MLIEEMFPPSPISGIPFMPMTRVEDPMEEMLESLGMGGPLGNGLTIDTIEEKVSADGSHHRKEVVNDHGHRKVTITEEKEIEVPGATSPQEVSKKILMEELANGGPMKEIDQMGERMIGMKAVNIEQEFTENPSKKGHWTEKSTEVI